MANPLTVYVDGTPVVVEEGSTLLDACDAACCYVPRLCHHPAISRRSLRLDVATRAVDQASYEGGGDVGERCGLCLVRLVDGSLVQACSTAATQGVEVCTDDEELSSLRTRRVADFLARHPHICLSCPDREGCSRDSCPHGVAVEARCCDKLGSCELEAVLETIDPRGRVPRRAVAVSREATVEGRIRKEPGLCLACGRCVSICTNSPEAGQALELAEVAHPKRGTLRESGCSFCGLCVLVCPTGALTALGQAGVKWLAGKREKYRLPSQVLPSKGREFDLPDGLDILPHEPGVFTLVDSRGEVVQIKGVIDLQRGVAKALEGELAHGPYRVRFELQPLYSQRETELLAQHVRDQGRLPSSDDLDDDLFTNDLD